MTKNRLLVVTSTNYFDVDRINAAVVLARIAAQKHEAAVDLLINFNIDNSLLARVTTIGDIRLVSSLTPQAPTLKLKGITTEVSDVRWQVVNGELKLEIIDSTGATAAVSDVTLSTDETPYDFVYTLGIHTREYLEKLISPIEFSALAGAAIHCIHRQEVKDTYSTNNFVNSESASFSEIVWHYLGFAQLPYTKADLTDLLTGIYWKTDSLRNMFTGEQTLASVKNIIAAGGSLPTAVTRIYSSLTPIEAKLWKEIFEDIKLVDNFAFAFASEETSRQWSSKQVIHPQINPLFNLRGVKASFILMPLGEKSTEVLASSVTKEISLRKLFKDNNFRGDEWQGRFTLEMQPQAALHFITGRKQAPAATSQKPLPITLAQDEQGEGIETPNAPKAPVVPVEKFELAKTVVEDPLPPKAA